jgi:hypothetical protein
MKKTVTISLEERNFVQLFWKAVGVPSGGRVRFFHPQFHRSFTDPPALPYPGDEEFFRLETRTSEELTRLGLKPWDDPRPGVFEGGVLWLLPGEWYGSIPAGAELVSISGKARVFQPGVTDCDIRFGVLAYGVVVHPC